MARAPAGWPDFHYDPHVVSLADVEIREGVRCIYDGEQCVVIVPPCGDDRVLVRSLEGTRRRLLVSVYDCGVEIDS